MKRMPIPRGTARKLRREAWARIRVQEEKFVERREWDPLVYNFIVHRVKITGWKPTFAEFSKREASHEK